MRPSPKQLSLQTQNPHSSGTGIRVFTSSGTSGKKVMPIFSSMKLTGTAIRRNSARALVSGLSVKVSIQKPTACYSSAVHC